MCADAYGPPCLSRDCRSALIPWSDRRRRRGRSPRVPLARAMLTPVRRPFASFLTRKARAQTEPPDTLLGQHPFPSPCHELYAQRGDRPMIAETSLRILAVGLVHA